MADEILDWLELSASEDGFTGTNQKLGYRRVFGGQLLAQLMVAAVKAVPGKQVKSFTTLFASEGDPETPLAFELQRHREGRAFAGLGITIHQAEKTIAAAIVSLHAPEEGPRFQHLAGPSSRPAEMSGRDLDLIPWETQVSADLDSREPGPPETEIWTRLPSPAAPMLAYLTDLTLIGTAVRPLDGVSQRTLSSSAVTSHSLWFHDHVPAGTWLLLRQHAPILSGNRCFGRGDVLTEAGELVASYAQEALVRVSRT
jgi:acyl-CoA thioesterase-2